MLPVDMGGLKNDGSFKKTLLGSSLTAAINAFFVEKSNACIVIDTSVCVMAIRPNRVFIIAGIYF